MRRRHFLLSLAAAPALLVSRAGTSRTAAAPAASGPVLRPEWWGARGVPGQDDTEPLRRALRAAYQAGGGTVELESGRVYHVTTLPLNPGITIEGNGATLRRLPDTATKWTRMLDCLHPEAIRWDAAEDSPLTRIRNLRVDGNRDEQSRWEGGFELEQAHLVLLSAEGSRGGRLRVRLENCETVENVADGVAVHSDVEVDIVDHYAENCFRGGITVLSGNSVTRVDGYTARGSRLSTAVNIEVEGSRRADIRFTRCRLQRGLFVIPGRASVTEFRDVVLEEPPYYFTGWSANRSRTGRVLVADSLLPGSEVRAGAARASAAFNPSGIEFRNVTFRIRKPAGHRGTRFCGMFVQWHESRTSQDLLLTDCRFEVDRSSFDGSETLFGIYSNPDRRGWHTRAELSTVRFGPGLDWALHASRGGTWVLEDVVSEADGLVRWSWSEGRHLDLTLVRVEHRGRGPLLHGLNRHRSDRNRIETRSVVVPEGWSGRRRPS